MFVFIKNFLDFVQKLEFNFLRNICPKRLVLDDVVVAFTGIIVEVIMIRFIGGVILVPVELFVLFLFSVVVILVDEVFSALEVNCGEVGSLGLYVEPIVGHDKVLELILSELLQIHVHIAMLLDGVRYLCERDGALLEHPLQ